MSKPKRKKISHLGWGVKWTSGQVGFYSTKSAAMHEIEYWPSIGAVLFRCKIEEIVK